MAVDFTNPSILTTQDFGGLEYVETYSDPRSPSESYGVTDAKVTRTFYVAWLDRHKFIAAILGYPQVAQTGSLGDGSYIKRAIPHSWGVFNTLNPTPHTAADLYANRVVRVEGMGVPAVAGVDFNPTTGVDCYSSGDSGGDIAAYHWAKVEVEYVQPLWDVKEDSAIPTTSDTPDESTLQRYVSIQVRPGADYLRLPPLAMKLVAANQVPQQTGKLQPNCDFAITWHQVPEDAVGVAMINPLLLDTHETRLGKVNADTFAGAAPGTLLLTAINVTRRRGLFGYWICDVEYRFKYLNLGAAKAPAGTDGLGVTAGHNHLYATNLIAGNGDGYYEVAASDPATTNYVTQTDGKSIYDWADFADLFRPAQ